MSNSTFKLTDQQITFFNTFGYLGFPGLMADSIDEITREFEMVWTDRGVWPPPESCPCVISYVDSSDAAK